MLRAPLPGAPKSRGSTVLVKCLTSQDFLSYLLGSVCWCTRFFRALGWQQRENCAVYVETTKTKRQAAAIWQNFWQMCTLNAPGSYPQIVLKSLFQECSLLSLWWALHSDTHLYVYTHKYVYNHLYFNTHLCTKLLVYLTGSGVCLRKTLWRK